MEDLENMHSLMVEPRMDFDRPDLKRNLTCIATKVELACGSTTLFKHPKHQTLLSRSPVEPIIPLAWLLAADYKITWKRDSIVIHHPIPEGLCSAA